MSQNNLKEKFWARAVNTLVLSAFLSLTIYPPSLANASIPTNPQVIHRVGVGLNLPYYPQGIEINKDLARIKKYHKGTNDKLIIHLQDLHVNYKSQKQAAQVIKDLTDKYGINLVLVEGGWGDVGLSELRGYASKDAREKLADEYLKRGEIAGEEYLDIISNKDFDIKLWGIEDESLYRKNLNQYIAIDNIRLEAQDFLNRLRHEVESLKTKIYNETLFKFDTETKKYKNDQSKLTEYCELLHKSAWEHAVSLIEHRNFNNFLRSARFEKIIDFDSVESERNEFVNKLSKILMKDSLIDFISKSQAHKDGRINESEYYNYVKKFAKRRNIDLGAYPNFRSYIYYSEIHSQINIDEFFKEIRKIEKSIKEALYTNDAERQLGKISANVGFLEKFVNIKLSPDEFNKIQSEKSKFNTKKWAKFLNNADYSPIIDKNFKIFEKFYKTAQKRDPIFIENAISTLEKFNQNSAILITGGFHTDNITSLLEDKGYSYIVALPSTMSKIEDDSKYRSILLTSLQHNIRPMSAQIRHVPPVFVQRLMDVEADFIHSSPTTATVVSKEAIDRIFTDESFRRGALNSRRLMLTDEEKVVLEGRSIQEETGKRKKTLRELGRELSFSTEGIRQIEIRLIEEKIPYYQRHIQFTPEINPANIEGRSVYELGYFSPYTYRLLKKLNITTIPDLLSKTQDDFMFESGDKEKNKTWLGRAITEIQRVLKLHDLTLRPGKRSLTSTRKPILAPGFPSEAKKLKLTDILPNTSVRTRILHSLSDLKKKHDDSTIYVGDLEGFTERNLIEMLGFGRECLVVLRAALAVYRPLYKEEIDTKSGIRFVPGKSLTAFEVVLPNNTAFSVSLHKDRLKDSVEDIVANYNEFGSPFSISAKMGFYGIKLKLKGKSKPVVIYPPYIMYDHRRAVRELLPSIFEKDRRSWMVDSGSGEKGKGRASPTHLSHPSGKIKDIKHNKTGYVAVQNHIGRMWVLAPTESGNVRFIQELRNIDGSDGFEFISETRLVTLAPNEDGKRCITLWDLKKGRKLTADIDATHGWAHSENLIVASGFDKRLIFIKAATGKLTLEERTVHAEVFDISGKRLAILTSNGKFVYKNTDNLATAKGSIVFDASDGFWFTGNRIITCGREKETNTSVEGDSGITVRNVKNLAQIGDELDITGGFDFSDEIIIARPKKARRLIVRDIESKQRTFTNIDSEDFQADGIFIVIREKENQDYLTGFAYDKDENKIVPTDLELFTPGGVFKACGGRVAAHDSSNCLRFADIQTGKLIITPEFIQGSFDLTEDYLKIFDSHGDIQKLIDAETGEEVNLKNIISHARKISALSRARSSTAETDAETEVNKAISRLLYTAEVGRTAANAGFGITYLMSAFELELRAMNIHAISQKISFEAALELVPKKEILCNEFVFESSRILYFWPIVLEIEVEPVKVGFLPMADEGHASQSRASAAVNPDDGSWMMDRGWREKGKNPDPQSTIQYPLSPKGRNSAALYENSEEENGKTKSEKHALEISHKNIGGKRTSAVITEQSIVHSQGGFSEDDKGKIRSWIENSRRRIRDLRPYISSEEAFDRAIVDNVTTHIARDLGKLELSRQGFAGVLLDEYIKRVTENEVSDLTATTHFELGNPADTVKRTEEFIGWLQKALRPKVEVGQVSPAARASAAKADSRSSLVGRVDGVPIRVSVKVGDLTELKGLLSDYEIRVRSATKNTLRNVEFIEGPFVIGEWPFVIGEWPVLEKGKEYVTDTTLNDCFHGYYKIELLKIKHGRKWADLEITHILLPTEYTEPDKNASEKAKKGKDERKTLQRLPRQRISSLGITGQMSSLSSKPGRNRSSAAGETDDGWWMVDGGWREKGKNPDPRSKIQDPLSPKGHSSVHSSPLVLDENIIFTPLDDDKTEIRVIDDNEEKGKIVIPKEGIKTGYLLKKTINDLLKRCRPKHVISITHPKQRDMVIQSTVKIWHNGRDTLISAPATAKDIREAFEEVFGAGEPEDVQDVQGPPESQRKYSFRDKVTALTNSYTAIGVEELLINVNFIASRSEVMDVGLYYMRYNPTGSPYERVAYKERMTSGKDANSITLRLNDESVLKVELLEGRPAAREAEFEVTVIPEKASPASGAARGSPTSISTVNTIIGEVTVGGIIKNGRVQSYFIDIADPELPYERTIYISDTINEEKAANQTLILADELRNTILKDHIEIGAYDEAREHVVTLTSKKDPEISASLKLPIRTIEDLGKIGSAIKEVLPPPAPKVSIDITASDIAVYRHELKRLTTNFEDTDIQSALSALETKLREVSDIVTIGNPDTESFFRILLSEIMLGFRNLHDKVKEEEEKISVGLSIRAPGIQHVARQIWRETRPSTLKELIENSNNEYGPFYTEAYSSEWDRVLDEIYGVTTDEVFSCLDRRFSEDESWWISMPELSCQLLEAKDRRDTGLIAYAKDCLGLEGETMRDPNKRFDDYLEWVSAIHYCAIAVTADAARSSAAENGRQKVKGEKQLELTMPKPNFVSLYNKKLSFKLRFIEFLKEIKSLIYNFIFGHIFDIDYYDPGGISDVKSQDIPEIFIEGKKGVIVSNNKVEDLLVGSGRQLYPGSAYNFESTSFEGFNNVFVNALISKNGHRNSLHRNRLGWMFHKLRGELDRSNDVLFLNRWVLHGNTVNRISAGDKVENVADCNACSPDTRFTESDSRVSHNPAIFHGFIPPSVNKNSTAFSVCQRENGNSGIAAAKVSLAANSETRPARPSTQPPEFTLSKVEGAASLRTPFGRASAAVNTRLIEEVINDAIDYYEKCSFLEIEWVPSNLARFVNDIGLRMLVEKLEKAEIEDEGTWRAYLDEFAKQLLKKRTDEEIGEGGPQTRESPANGAVLYANTDARSSAAEPSTFRRQQLAKNPRILPVEDKPEQVQGAIRNSPTEEELIRKARQLRESLLNRDPGVMMDRKSTKPVKDFLLQELEYDNRPEFLWWQRPVYYLRFLNEVMRARGIIDHERENYIQRIIQDLVPLLPEEDISNISYTCGVQYASTKYLIPTLLDILKRCPGEPSLGLVKALIDICRYEETYPATIKKYVRQAAGTKSSPAQRNSRKNTRSARIRSYKGSARDQESPRIKQEIKDIIEKLTRQYLEKHYPPVIATSAERERIKDFFRQTIDFDKLLLRYKIPFDSKKAKDLRKLFNADMKRASKTILKERCSDKKKTQKTAKGSPRNSPAFANLQVEEFAKQGFDASILMLKSGILETMPRVKVWVGNELRGGDAGGIWRRLEESDERNGLERFVTTKAKASPLIAKDLKRLLSGEISIDDHLLVVNIDNSAWENSLTEKERTSATKLKNVVIFPYKLAKNPAILPQAIRTASWYAAVMKHYKRPLYETEFKTLYRAITGGRELSISVSSVYNNPQQFTFGINLYIPPLDRYESGDFYKLLREYADEESRA